MNNLDKTIRSLKSILDDIEDIDDNIVFHENRGVYDLGMSKYHINSMIIDLESKYQKLHRIGAHND